MSTDDTAERLMVDENTSNSPLFLRHKMAYIFSEQYAKNKVVLDDGCGSGYGSFHLISNGAQKVTGIDLSQEAIEYANEKYKNKNLNFIQMDVTKLNFNDNTFDTLTSFQVIEHIKEVDKYLNEIKRVLRNGGVALITTPNKQTYSPNTIGPENPFHVKEYYLEELKNLLDIYFSKVQILGVNHSKKVDNLEDSAAYSFRKNVRIILQKINMAFLFNLIPQKIKTSILRKLNKNINISDFTVSQVDVKHTSDFMAVCIIEK
ncbi:MAG: hypothetical protein A2Y12_06455 [Planctomycetes bacterium GWF2_42_9]|nr:MAG: hypothetical protein A2Y12_06455 [Planctomycetes bacterium GWF2_42_9]HAL45299.1 hypothetical protein [Phycisphaerales bacterium]